MLVNPFHEEFLRDVWPEPLLVQCDSVCFCPVAGCLQEEADSHLAAASLGLCQVHRLLLHMWRLKLVSFLYKLINAIWAWALPGLWVQLTIMMHAVKTWHLLSTDRLPSLLRLWAWVCPLPWGACHHPEPQQHWWESREGCRSYQETT